MPFVSGNHESNVIVILAILVLPQCFVAVVIPYACFLIESYIF